MTFSVPMEAGTVCFKCRGAFKNQEPRIVIVYAGSAWKNGQAEFVDGAEMFVSRTFHEHHAPKEGQRMRRRRTAEVKQRTTSR